MTLTPHLIFALVAVILFMIASTGVSGRIDLAKLGMAFFIIALLIV